jgi:spermidine synthase
MSAKAALRPGGVFCQWLPLTQLTREHFALIAATFQQAFGEVYLFRDHLRNSSLPIALVGFKKASLDWDVVARRCEFERNNGLLRDPLCRHPEGLAMLYLGTYTSVKETEHRSNTLDNLRVELDAGRHLIAGNPADYFAGVGDLWLGFVQAQLSRIEDGQELPPALRSLPRLALSVSRWHAAREAGEPDSPELQREWSVALPACISTDPAADWSLWPSHDLNAAGP